MTSEFINRLSKDLNVPESELISKGVLSYLEREFRLAEEDIADLREKYHVVSRTALEYRIRHKEIPSHPAWEDLIAWENLEAVIQKLKGSIQKISKKAA